MKVLMVLNLSEETTAQELFEITLAVRKALPEGLRAKFRVEPAPVDRKDVAPAPEEPDFPLSALGLMN